MSNLKTSAKRMLFATVAAATALAFVPNFAIAGGSSSGLSDKPAPMIKEEDLPERTAPIVEIGPKFLGPGNLPEGIELPTGAVWTPAFWVFGSSRTAVQYYDSGSADEVGEAVTRLDLFGNLQFTPTERVLIGFSPITDGSKFTRCRWSPDPEDCTFESNIDPTVFFAEGEFGEIFPNLDPSDSQSLDIGFAVGRQPLFFQEGLLVNDTIDGIGITRDNIVLPSIVDTRVTGFWGWGNIDRDNNKHDEDAQLFGLFTESDFDAATANLDIIYVNSDVNTTKNSGGDGLYVGLQSSQRFGLINTAARITHSFPLDRDTAQIADGTLVFGELSTTPAYTNDVFYANGYVGLNEYSSAARGPTNGGPLGRVGILYSAVGLGSYGSALSNRADNVYGAAIGYQKFFNGERTQLVMELGGRNEIEGTEQGAVAIGARFQHAIGSRVVWQNDGFLAYNKASQNGAGLRSEILVRF